MIRKFYHCSSHDFAAKVGDTIILHPGKQNAQGVGVYFSEGVADERASDSCYENGGSKTVFILDVEASCSGPWWSSKNSRDKKKNRPKTWHSNGANVKVTVTRVDGKFVYGHGERV